MTTGKFTPGPWEADVTDWPLLITRKDDDQQCIAQIPEADRYWPDDETSRANARLIAKAPELRDLVAQAFDRFTDNDMQPPNSTLGAWLRQTSALLAEIDGDKGE
jgi:hypothetical protein